MFEVVENTASEVVQYVIPELKLLVLDVMKLPESQEKQKVLLRLDLVLKALRDALIAEKMKPLET